MRISSNSHKTDASADTELVVAAPRTQPLRAIVMPNIRIYDSYEHVRYFSNREQELSIFAWQPFLIFLSVVLFWLVILFRDTIAVLYTIVSVIFDKLR